MNALVSVVMPVRNESRFIARSLASVLSQDYPNELLEVIVVDGLSEDDTREIIDRVSSQMLGRPSLVQVVDNPKRTVPAALNLGISRARGDVIVRVDGHCEVMPNYVSLCVEALEATKADNVGGLHQTQGDTRVGRAIARATSSAFGIGSSRFRRSQTAGWVDSVTYGAYRRDVFSRIGLFDEDLVRNQDDEFNLRLTQAGGKIWLDPAIKISYRGRSSLRSLWRQYYGYGMYKVLVVQKRGGVWKSRHVVPSALVVGVGLSAAVALATRNPFWACAVAGAYLVATVAASIRAARGDAPSALLLPLVFVVLHWAYGLGFLSGLWRWRRGFLRVPTAGKTETDAPRAG